MSGLAILNFFELAGISYLGIGVLFSLFFLARGVQILDSASLHASKGFRIIILPGVILLWPFLGLGWRHFGNTLPSTSESFRTPRRNLQSPVMLFLIGLALALLFMGLLLRKPLEYSAPPTQLMGK